MEAMRAVLMCAVLCGAVVAEFVSDKLNRNHTERESIAYYDSSRRVSHRVQLLFPLLLRISSRLATLISTAMMGLAGIFFFVAFSKKALIVSLLALFLTYLDKKDQGQRDDIVHIHRIKDLHRFDHGSEEHLHYRWPHPQMHRHPEKSKKRFYMFSQYPSRQPPRTHYQMRSVYEIQPSFLSSWAYIFESPIANNDQKVPIDQIET